METNLVTQSRCSDTIPGLDDLRRLSPTELSEVASGLRDYLLRSVSHSGGHFAAGLGAVELTVALHYVYRTPFDRLVWDTGHQTYPHKILTGRGPALSTVRQKGGLSGFPHRVESEFDTFGVAHAGTAVSAALGMAEAARGEGRGRRVIAIVGDGGITAGMTYEALNHAGSLSADMLVVLNDNEMSISPSVGGLQEFLHWVKRRSGLAAPCRGPSAAPASAPAAVDERSAGKPFEFLGFTYSGPVDGHDVEALVDALHRLRECGGPQLLHVATQKGKGYAPAEADPVKYHGVTPFDPHRGLVKSGGGSPTYTEVFGEWVCDMAEQDPSLTVITPAMREGSGLVGFAAKFPERYYDAAIAEQHAMTMAAGLACEGKHPVVAIYSTFLQRAYDQLIHDVALQNLPVLLAIDRAGLVGPDGPTHAGSFDLGFLRCVPNMVVMAPADEDECRQMLYTGFRHSGPAAVRYPRCRGPGRKPRRQMGSIPLGRAEVRREGRRVAILAFGAMVPLAEQIGERMGSTVVNMRFVKPLDTALLEQLAADHELLVTLEDNAVAGGAGSAVNEHLVTASRSMPGIVNLGLPDLFLDHGTRDELFAQCGLDVQSVCGVIERHWAVREARGR